MKYDKMTKPELYELAKTFNIKNRSAMSRDELVKALKKYDKAVIKDKKPEEETVSSHAAPQEPVKYEAPKALKPDYPIPDRYNIDTVVLLPVNPKKEYVYWEVSDKTVHSFCETSGTKEAVFILKVFAGEEDNFSELASVRVGKYGNWYFDLYCPEARMWSEIGMLDSMGNYHVISCSKRIKMPTDRISDLVDEETWMTVGDNLEKIYSLSGLSELQKKELLSSARMHSELFKKLHKAEGAAGSSFSVTKKGGE